MMIRVMIWLAIAGLVSLLGLWALAVLGGAS
jgi:hypothetical protein